MDPLPKFLVNLLLSFYYLFENVYRLVFPRDAKDVSNDVVLITGGANGLGRALALRFAARSARVVLWDVDKAGLEDAARAINEVGGQAWTYVVDITDKQKVAETAVRVKEDVGFVSILVNNAGVVSGKSFLELDDADITRTFDVNAISHFWTTKAFLPEMLALKQGHVVTIASIAGHMSANKLVDYCASKHAAVGFTDALRYEIKSDGFDDVHVTEISPYYMDTNMFYGVQPAVTRALDVDRVAVLAMEGILTNRERVYIPFFFAFFVALKNIVPFKSLFMAEKALGECESMIRFVGRTIDSAIATDEDEEEPETSTQEPSSEVPPPAPTSQPDKEPVARPVTQPAPEAQPSPAPEAQPQPAQPLPQTQPKPEAPPATASGTDTRTLSRNFDDRERIAVN